MMRIAIFTELYSPSVGGQEMFFHGLAKALQRRGHTLEVYCIGHEKGLPATETIDGIVVHRAPDIPGYKKPRIAAMKRRWGGILRFAWQVRAVARRAEHDVYLLNQWPFLHAMLLPRRARQRALLHWCEIRRSGFYRAWQKHLPRRVGLNAAISESVAAQIQHSSGRHVLALPSGLDLSRSQYLERAKRRDILALGRVAAHKNLGFLIEAFELLKARGYGGRLKIAGDGPELPALRKRVAASPVCNDIELLGFIADETKFHLLSTGEVLAMPSKREGFPHVVAEAMCCGLPVVTADYPENGTRSVIQAFESGVVTAPTVESFADGISKALSDWERYSSNGRTGSTRLDWNGIASSLEDSLTELLEGSGEIAHARH
jgi:glycosyltransferase involved in cell wall biosynthesis